MKFFLSFLCLVVVLLALPLPVFAASVKGVGAVEYGGVFGPSKDDQRKALELARYNAIERFVSKGGRSKVKLLEKNRQQVEDSIDRVLSEVSVVDTQKDSDLKRLKLVVRVTIDEPVLNMILAEDDGKNTEEEYITFVFVAREQSSVKSYDDRKLKRIEEVQANSGLDAENSDDASAEYTSKSKKTKQLETGGSTTRKADVVSYRVTTVNEVNTMMSSVFSDADFEVVEAEYLEDESGGLMSVEAFKRDYGQGDDINSRTLKNAAKGLKMLDIPYLAIGTMDVGLPGIDKETGLTLVYVTVTGKVSSLKKRFPRTVASTGPVQFAGLGPNASVAKTNALKLAAEQTALTLTEQLRSKQ